MPDPNANMNEAFREFSAVIEQFAHSSGGIYSSNRGIDEREIETSKSALNVWTDRNVLDPLLDLFGKGMSHEGLMEQFERIYCNACVDCTYRGWLIRFHARNVGFGSEAGQFGLVVRCEVSASSNFSLSICGDGNTVRTGKSMALAQLSGVMRSIIPAGVLNATERAPGTEFRIEFHSSELGGKYSGATSVAGLGEKILQNSAIQRCLAKLPQIHLLNAGYGDRRLGTDKVLVELEENVDASLEQLTESLNLMKHMLDTLNGAGLIDAAVSQ